MKYQLPFYHDFEALGLYSSEWTYTRFASDSPENIMRRWFICINNPNPYMRHGFLRAGKY